MLLAAHCLFLLVQLGTRSTSARIEESLFRVKLHTRLVGVSSAIALISTKRTLVLSDASIVVLFEHDPFTNAFLLVGLSKVAAVYRVHVPRTLEYLVE